MTKEDFEGIDRHDTIVVNGIVLGFKEFTPSLNFSGEGIEVYGPGFARHYEFDEIKTLSVLTGKLAPWSSSFVPDWAEWCVQSRIDGSIDFFTDEEWRYAAIDPNEDIIVTKRPSWRGKNE